MSGLEGGNTWAEAGRAPLEGAGAADDDEELEEDDVTVNSNSASHFRNHVCTVRPSDSA